MAPPVIPASCRGVVIALAGYCFDDRPSARPLSHRLRKPHRDSPTRRSSRADSRTSGRSSSPPRATARLEVVLCASERRSPRRRLIDGKGGVCSQVGGATGLVPRVSWQPIDPLASREWRASPAGITGPSRLAGVDRPGHGAGHRAGPRPATSRASERRTTTPPTMPASPASSAVSTRADDFQGRSIGSTCGRGRVGAGPALLRLNSPYSLAAVSLL